jgi:hypothetical protein
MNDVTDEQIGAVKLLTHPRVYYSMTMEEQDALKVVLGMLPESVKNLQPVLPTEPGWYQGFDKVARSQVTIRLADNGNWGYGISGSTLLANPERFAPFTRLVPERPQVTRDQIAALIMGHENVHDAISAILALVNGTSA